MHDGRNRSSGGRKFEDEEIEKSDDNGSYYTVSVENISDGLGPGSENIYSYESISN